MDISKEKMIDMYTIMNRIRMFEIRVSELFAAGKIAGFVHLYAGEEAVATGVSANLLCRITLPAPTAGTGI